MNRNSRLPCDRRQSGSALVEFAVFTPILMIMLCGVMDFSRVIYAGIAVASAARAGVQFGALTPGNSGDTNGMIQAAVDDAANQGLTGLTASARNFCGCAGSTSEVACSATCSGATPNGYVEVTATYTFHTLVNMYGVPSSVAISKSARMRVQ